MPLCLGSVMAEMNFRRFRCEGGGNGKRFLVGDVATGRVSLGAGNDPGALWLLRPFGADWTIACWANADFLDVLSPLAYDEPRFLDGNIFNSEVQLVNKAAPPFSGTRWFDSDSGDFTSFTCLGEGGAADAPRLLDGWIDKGTVQLRQGLAQFTGTRWSLVQPL